MPCALISASQSPGALTATERALVTAIDADRRTRIALLERAVNINSGTQNFEGVRQVGALFRAEFDALGFKTEWVDGAAWQARGPSRRRRTPARGPKMLLIGHLDTVFERDSPFQKFERIDDTRPAGPASST